jgi:hypothetical protein
LGVQLRATDTVAGTTEGAEADATSAELDGETGVDEQADRATAIAAMKMLSFTDVCT